MDALISRITASVGIDAEVARKAVGIILSFLDKDGPSEPVGQLLDGLPGARELLAAYEAGDSGGGPLGGLGNVLAGLGGSMGGSMGAMAALNKLTGAGLDLDQVKDVVSEFVAYSKEQAGDGVVDEIVASIPALRQYAS